MEENNLTQKIAECIVPYRKRTERMVGYIPYSLNFEILFSRPCILYAID